MDMRTTIPVIVALLGLACAKEPEATTPPGPAAGESCAAYIQRAAGVACLNLDAMHCQCELPGAAPLQPAQPEQPAQPAQPTQPTQPTQPAQPAQPAGPGAVTAPQVKQATLAFGQVPPYTTAQCMSGPCPTQAPVMIGVAGYPPVPIAGEAATVRFEFRAPGHKPATLDFRLVPGQNPINVALEPTGAADLKKATIAFSGAPAGTLVACVSGPCPDKAQRPVTDAFPEFALGETDKDNSVILQFSAPGFRTEANLYILQPGRNRIPVELEPVKPDGR